MRHLFAPWRESWVISAASGASSSSAVTHKCLFCECWDAADHDHENLVVHRGQGCLVMLNRYPYNGGHLMVVPRDHVETLPRVPRDQRSELMDLTTQSLAIAQELWSPAGFNVGINQGPAAGAGIPHHIHQHVVPRWQGDTGFMTTVGGTRVVSIDLAGARNALATAFRQHFAP